MLDKNFEIFNGDSLEVLKTFPDNSIDSIVTDPPYGLSFMGKKWDYDVPSVDVWKECLRVLKPGGHLLSFAGTRTQHRMAVNIEDAGFEIRDMIAWVYGCYSEDTECLTDSGWKKYNELTLTDKVLQWDHEKDILFWKPPKQLFCYDYNGEMIQFNNRNTNQLLTPNHRCYVNYSKKSSYPFCDGYEVLEARNIKKQYIVNFPLASKLTEGKYVEHAYLIGWWLTDAWLHKDGKACMFSQSKPETLDKLKNYLLKNNFKFSEYIKESKKETHNNEHTFYLTGDIAGYLIENFPERELLNEVLEWDYNSRLNLLNGLMDGDGTVRKESHSKVFWSMRKERLDIFSALCLSLNYRNHIDYEKGCVYFNVERNTTQLQSKHRENPISYNGKVWCLETDTGAFVVRRNGKPFISGNSGFPKSLDVSKAIDKKAGAEREKIRTPMPPSGNKYTQGLGDSRPWRVKAAQTGYHEHDGNVPLTEEAKQWEGFGSALKPALEPITVARKPFTGTIANNVLTHGTGALNIDGCRIPTEDKLSGSNVNPDKDYSTLHEGWRGSWMFDKKMVELRAERSKASVEKSENLGRWPANFIHDGSEEVLDLFPYTKSGKDKTPTKNKVKGFFGSEMNYYSSDANYGDQGSAARFFYCAKASKTDREEGLEEFERKKSGFVSNTSGQDMTRRDEVAPRANNHPTVKPTNLMKYLCRLVTPPNGIILDPFMGSGSTGKAAILENFRFIGIEREKDYCEISRARIEYAEKNDDTPKVTPKKKEVINTPEETNLFT